MKTLPKLWPKHSPQRWLMQTSITLPEQQGHNIPRRITGLHVWQMLAGSAAVSSGSSLKASAAVVSTAFLLLGCKFSGWLLSLRIDPLRHLEPRYWHMGRRWAGGGGGGVAIYRPSIMTFIDDVTTGARGVEVGAPSLNGHPVCSCVIVCAHVHTQSNSMSVCVCVPPLTADLMAAILSFPRQMVHWTMSLAEYSWPL